ncbi:MAG: DUF2933 domain-containing protein [Ramlibacter sp.]|nr:DUF2933 domain-containing protein [Ramlibacter sp.]
MDPAHHTEDDERSHSRWKWALAGFLAVAAFFLWTEHRAHLLGILPYLLILACPLMHIFHHGGHGRHGAHRHGATQDDDERRPGRAPGDPS